MAQHSERPNIGALHEGGSDSAASTDCIHASADRQARGWMHHRRRAVRQRLDHPRRNPAQVHHAAICQSGDPSPPNRCLRRDRPAELSGPSLPSAACVCTLPRIGIAPSIPPTGELNPAALGAWSSIRNRWPTRNGSSPAGHRPAHSRSVYVLPLTPRTASSTANSISTTPVAPFTPSIRRTATTCPAKITPASRDIAWSASICVVCGSAVCGGSCATPHSVARITKTNARAHAIRTPHRDAIPHLRRLPVLRQGLPEGASLLCSHTSLSWIRATNPPQAIAGNMPEVPRAQLCR